MHSTGALVSIGLVTRNRADMIGIAIDQLMSQTYKNLEIIISDNCSDDSTQTICEAYAKKDPRIRYIRQEKNIGMYNNFNFVLAEATGDYFLWATDDDEWEATFVERMMKLHEKHKSAVVATSNYILFSDNHKETTHHTYPEISSPPKSTEIYLYHAVFITYGVVKTAALKEIKGFFKYPWPIPDGIGDTLLAMRILLRGDIAFDQGVLWKKRDSGYTFEKYNVLSNWHFSPAVLYRIRRYLLFPLLYIYNLVYMAGDVISSRYPLSIKSVLLYQALGFFIISNLEYVCNIFKGICALCKGLLRRFFRIDVD